MWHFYWSFSKWRRCKHGSERVNFHLTAPPLWLVQYTVVSVSVYKHSDDCNLPQMYAANACVHQWTWFWRVFSAFISLPFCCRALASVETMRWKCCSKPTSLSFRCYTLTRVDDMATTRSRTFPAEHCFLLAFWLAEESSRVCMFRVLILMIILVLNCEVLWASQVRLGAI